MTFRELLTEDLTYVGKLPSKAVVKKLVKDWVKEATKLKVFSKVTVSGEARRTKDKVVVYIAGPDLSSDDYSQLARGSHPLFKYIGSATTDKFKVDELLIYNKEKAKKEFNAVDNVSILEVVMRLQTEGEYSITQIADFLSKQNEE